MHCVLGELDLCLASSRRTFPQPLVLEPERYYAVGMEHMARRRAYSPGLSEPSRRSSWHQWASIENVRSSKTQFVHIVDRRRQTPPSATISCFMLRQEAPGTQWGEEVIIQLFVRRLGENPF